MSAEICQLWTVQWISRTESAFIRYIVSWEVVQLAVHSHEAGIFTRAGLSRNWWYEMVRNSATHWDVRHCNWKIIHYLRLARSSIVNLLSRYRDFIRPTDNAYGLINTVGLYKSCSLKYIHLSSMLPLYAMCWSPCNAHCGADSRELNVF